MGLVCQLIPAVCKRLQFWLAETVCSDLQYPKRAMSAYAWSGNQGFEVVA